MIRELGLQRQTCIRGESRPQYEYALYPNFTHIARLPDGPHRSQQEADQAESLDGLGDAVAFITPLRNWIRVQCAVWPFLDLRGG